MFLIGGLLHLLTWMFSSVIFLVLFGLWVYCVYDCATRRFSDPNHKIIWMVVLLVSLPLSLFWLSAMAYLMFGRGRSYRY